MSWLWSTACVVCQLTENNLWAPRLPASLRFDATAQARKCPNLTYARVTVATAATVICCKGCPFNFRVRRRGPAHQRQSSGYQSRQLIIPLKDKSRVRVTTGGGRVSSPAPRRKIIQYWWSARHPRSIAISHPLPDRHRQTTSDKGVLARDRKVFRALCDV